MNKKTSGTRVPNKISDETKKLLVKAVDDALVLMGFPDLELARGTFREFMEKGPSAENFEIGFRSATMILLADYIENMPEPTPEKLAQVLEKFKTMPFDFRKTLNQSVKSVKRKLPRKPGGGRREVLTIAQKKEACRQVGLLWGEGRDFQDVLKIVGRRFGVSARTIQRAWQNRTELYGRKLREEG